MNKEQIARNLISLRGEKSREEVAGAIGIGISAVGMYERGERIPKDELKVKIASYYGVSVESIFFAN